MLGVGAVIGGAVIGGAVMGVAFAGAEYAVTTLFVGALTGWDPV